MRGVKNRMQAAHVGRQRRPRQHDARSAEYELGDREHERQRRHSLPRRIRRPDGNVLGPTPNRIVASKDRRLSVQCEA